MAASGLCSSHLLVWPHQVNDQVNDQEFDETNGIIGNMVGNDPCDILEDTK